MPFQEQLLDASAGLRARAAALAHRALDLARSRADIAAKRVDRLKGSMATLAEAGRELNKVAQVHASRFVKDNSTLALAAGKDVRAIARSAYAALATRKVAKAPARKPRATRKRAARKAA